MKLDGKKSKTVDDLHPARIIRMLNTSRLARTVVLFDRIDSTNTGAIAAARDGALEGTLVTAEEQTSGRGRKKRKWASAAGKSLVFSLVLRPKESCEGLTSLLALAASRVLDNISGGTGIKWPNDIYIEGRKAGGILAESRGGAVVIGMGLNVNETGEDLERELAGEAVSLRIVTGDLVDRGIVLCSIIEVFEELYGRWEIEGFAVFKKDVEDRLLYMGETVSLESGRE
ncbi:MAG: biotin--[acetyl-CoA-carboxylase] ligase, partial [Candidatus Krumholzibacteria bacterium]|nr:biotin--[acetyl-CoA-carboxylase] ligase [Candidatus Krumholzibacteria bacterium]